MREATFAVTFEPVTIVEALADLLDRSDNRLLVFIEAEIHCALPLRAKTKT
jgi:hypothetical protein